MPFLEQHVGHMLVALIDEEALYPPDLAIQGMDVITTTHVYFAHRDNVVYDDRVGSPRPMPTPTW